MSHAEIVAWFRERALRDGDCWITHTAKSAAGYGVITINSSPVYLHRLTLEIHLGRELQSDELACHRCNRPSCINPDHLYAGSRHDNSMDLINAGNYSPPSRLPGETNPNARLTAWQVGEIRRRYRAGGVTLKTLGDEFGVSFGAISHIITGRTWTSV